MQLVEFADFQCVFCQQNHRELSAFLAAHPEVGVAYRHLPLPQHPAAEGAARAAICAEQQAAFKSFHDYLFETSQWQDKRHWSEIARAVGVADLATFEQCLHSPATAERLSRDKELAKALGITGTPAWVTQREVVERLQTDVELKGLLGFNR